MSNFSYQDSSGKLTQIPVRYGDPSRQVAAILNKNSENVMPSAPFIACYIKDFKYDRSRLQDPTFISTVNIRERDVDENGDLLYTQGNNYTVERIMPSPYKVTFSADLWSSNTDQKFQIIEQIAMIFNPSLDLQTTDNYLDWTSLNTLTLTDQGSWSSRQIPQGIDINIEISTMIFEAPVWITPPAKVKQLNIITKFISNVFAGDGTQFKSLEEGYAYQINGTADASIIVTPGNLELLVLDGVATLLNQGTDGSDPNTIHSWSSILDLYPGKFTANLSQLRLLKPNGLEIVAFMTMNPNDETQMMLRYDSSTIPGNTVIDGRTTVDAIINPEIFVPSSKVTGTRYLILEDITAVITVGPAAWLNGDGSGFIAKANDIIEWNGNAWTVVFDSTTVITTTYITNAYTGIQYMWNGSEWTKSFEGIYDKDAWRLIL
jgi:hypothetical protein